MQAGALLAGPTQTERQEPDGPCNSARGAAVSTRQAPCATASCGSDKRFDMTGYAWPGGTLIQPMRITHS